jgi:hypothetical protein
MGAIENPADWKLCDKEVCGGQVCGCGYEGMIGLQPGGITHWHVGGTAYRKACGDRMRASAR